MLPARSGLEKIVSEALHRAPRSQAAIFAWPVVCGAAVAAHTEAVSQDENSLRVVVPDATWKAQLEAFQPQYLRALQQMTGLKLERIEFEVAGGKRAGREKR